MSRISSSAAIKKDRATSRRSIGLAALVVLGALLPAAAFADSGSSSLDGPSSAYQSGPIWDGRQHQPRLGKVIEREQVIGLKPGISADTSKAAEELYQRILDLSRHGKPTRLDEPC